MKKFARSTATAAVLTGLLLSVSGCGGAQNTPDTAPAQSGAPAAPTASPSPVRSSPAGGEVAFTFESPLRNAYIAKPWNGGDGWTEQGVDQMFSLPNHVGYIYSSESKNGSGLAIYNGEGKIVADVKTPPEIRGKEGILNHEVLTVWQGGKMYIVYIQSGRDSKNDLVNVISTFDEDANQVAVRVLPGTHTFTIDQGAFIIRDYQKSGDDVTFDPETGNTTVIDENKDREWIGRVDGVDIFRSGEKIGTDKWEAASNSFDTVGKYLSVMTDYDARTCDIIDPHTGKALEGTNGACPIHVDDMNPEENVPGSSVDGMILEKDSADLNAAGGNEKDAVLYLPSEKKAVTVGWAEKFTALSVDSDGVFYGFIGEEEIPASIDVKKGGKLTPIEGAKQAPVMVTGNGIAAFTTTEYQPSHLFHGMIQFVIPKK